MHEGSTAGLCFMAGIFGTSCRTDRRITQAKRNLTTKFQQADIYVLVNKLCIE